LDFNIVRVADSFPFHIYWKMQLIKVSLNEYGLYTVQVNNVSNLAASLICWIIINGFLLIDAIKECDKEVRLYD